MQVQQVGAVVNSVVVVKMMMINLMKQAYVELKVSIHYFYFDNCHIGVLCCSICR